MPERDLLGTAVAGSRVVDVVAEIVRSSGWHPGQWRPEMDYEGGLIEFVSEESCRIHWKTEVGIGRFQPIEVTEHRSLHSAAAEWLRRMFSSDIDGIRIDWSSRAVS
ncbi:MAG: hypothetical protein WD066_17460 [Planctomycetaceae bacterium]